MSTADELLGGTLHTVAVKLASDGGRIDAAVHQLAAIAGRRGDLLAEHAGVLLGVASVRGSADQAIAAGLLILAGADRDRVAEWVEVGRQRASTVHNAPDVTQPKTAPPSE